LLIFIYLFIIVFYFILFWLASFIFYFRKEKKNICKGINLMEKLKHEKSQLLLTSKVKRHDYEKSHIYCLQMCLINTLIILYLLNVIRPSFVPQDLMVLVN
jgi:hypothetical protein